MCKNLELYICRLNRAAAVYLILSHRKVKRLRESGYSSDRTVIMPVLTLKKHTTNYCVFVCVGISATPDQHAPLVPEKKIQHVIEQ